MAAETAWEAGAREVGRQLPLAEPPGPRLGRAVQATVGLSFLERLWG